MFNSHTVGKELYYVLCSVFTHPQQRNLVIDIYDNIAINIYFNCKLLCMLRTQNYW